MYDAKVNPIKNMMTYRYFFNNSETDSNVSKWVVCRTCTLFMRVSSSYLQNTPINPSTNFKYPRAWVMSTPLPVGHPLVLLLVLHDPDDDRVRDRAAEVGGGDGVEALVPGDVVLEEHGVDVGRVVVGLDAEVLAVRVVVLVPDHLRRQGESG